MQKESMNLVFSTNFLFEDSCLLGCCVAKVREKFSLSTPLRHTGGAETQLHSFLTWARDGGDWSTSCPGYFIQGMDVMLCHWVNSFWCFEWSQCTTTLQNVGTNHPVTKCNISDDLNLQQYYYLIFDNSHSFWTPLHCLRIISNSCITRFPSTSFKDMTI